MDHLSAGDLRGWVPIRFYLEDGRAMVDWCYLGLEGEPGMARFVEPFFDDTIQRCLRRPFNLAFRPQTSVETLLELQAEEPVVPPSGFIFHMSRCGSTLVSQMLAALPRNIVISEAGPIDAVLLAPAASLEEHVSWLRGIVGAYGRPRTGEETHYFVKLDSWHALALPFIRRAFPETPWIFLYRVPLEVVASQTRQPGAQMLPGVLPPALFGLDMASAVAMGFPRYRALILATICRAALRHRDAAGRFVNYRQLPDVLWQLLPEHFGVHVTEAEQERMRAVTRFDAKTPALPFEDDTRRKQESLSASDRALAEFELQPLFDELESVRREAEAPLAVHT